MNLFQLRYFVKLAYTKHYTRAAQELCITQPSLSHAINQLETELGVPLFEKSGRGTALTRFGEDFLKSVEQSLAILDEATQNLRLAAKGEGLIRLGSLRALGVDYLPELMSRFLDTPQGENVHFTMRTGVTIDLINGLKNREYDMIFSSKPADDAPFDILPVARQDLVLIVPKDHPLASRTTIDIEETLDEPYIIFSQGSGLRYVTDEIFAQVSRRPQPVFEIQEDQVIAGMVARGFGIAIVPYMNMLLRLNVQIIQISRPIVERKLYLVTNKNLELTPAARNFRNFALDSVTQTQVSYRHKTYTD